MSHYCLFTYKLHVNGTKAKLMKRAGSSFLYRQTKLSLVPDLNFLFHHHNRFTRKVSKLFTAENFLNVLHVNPFFYYSWEYVTTFKNWIL